MVVRMAISRGKWNGVHYSGAVKFAGCADSSGVAIPGLSSVLKSHGHRPESYCIPTMPRSRESTSMHETEHLSSLQDMMSVAEMPFELEALLDDGAVFPVDLGAPPC